MSMAVFNSYASHYQGVWCICNEIHIWVWSGYDNHHLIWNIWSKLWGTIMRCQCISMRIHYSHYSIFKRFLHRRLRWALRCHRRGNGNGRGCGCGGFGLVDPHGRLAVVAGNDWWSIGNLKIFHQCLKCCWFLIQPSRSSWWYVLYVMIQPIPNWNVELTLKKNAFSLIIVIL